MTEAERLEYNSAVIAYQKAPTEENKARLEEIKDRIYSGITERFLENYKVFERKQGKIVIQNAEHIVNIDKVEVFNG